MTEKNIPKMFLIRLSILSCLLSVIIFSYFLFQGNNTREKEAKAYIYTSDQVIVAINEERKKVGLEPLIVNQQLMEAARLKAEDMNNKNYFSHISPIDGIKWSDFIKKSGYEYSIAGENLANGFVDIDTMVRAWMNSPSHKENILNNTVQETGVSVLSGKLNNYPTIFVVQVFGKKISKEESTQIQLPDVNKNKKIIKNTEKKEEKDNLGEKMDLKNISYPRERTDSLES